MDMDNAAKKIRERVKKNGSIDFVEADAAAFDRLYKEILEEAARLNGLPEPIRIKPIRRSPKQFVKLLYTTATESERRSQFIKTRGSRAKYQIKQLLLKLPGMRNFKNWYKRHR